MTFSSTIFLFIFLPTALVGYYFLYNFYPKSRNIFLITISFLFYAYGEINFFWIMVISIFVNYIFGLLVDKHREDKCIHFYIVLMVIYNLSILIVYKYLNFIIDNINSIFNTNIYMTNIILPIGISFFTFQEISYVIDVYHKRGKVLKNPFDVALYVSFFPQLVAGPIVRYESIEKQITVRTETLNEFVYGIKRFIYGLSKKCILANTLASTVDIIFNIREYNNLSVLTSWIGIICYSLQIYFDFSGYSDMAIGLASMFGFKLEENFNYPYISSSISDFWRRWHISLGTWFRDYVYIPLGGNRVNNVKLISNLFIVWLLTGIWHGANWNFILWGLFYFILLVLEKLFKIPTHLNSPILKAIYRIITLVLIMVGWVLFRSNSIMQAENYYKCMLGANQNIFASHSDLFIIKNNIVVILISIIVCCPIIGFIKNKNFYKNKIKIFEPLIEFFSCTILFIASISFVIRDTYNPFIYFNF